MGVTMPEKAEALGILLVLLPGFAAAYLVQLLAARRKQSELDKIVEALIFSLVLYLLTLPFFGYSLPIAWYQGDKNQPDAWRILVIWPQLLMLAILAVVLGAIYAASINRNWLTAPFRWFRVPERSARSSVWNDVFSDLRGWVQV
jgi:fructose-specific phosphotransferase system IIC component